MFLPRKASSASPTEPPSLRPFAVYTALYPPPEETDENRVLTTYTTMSAKTSHRSLLNRGWIKGLLFVWVLFGTWCVFSLPPPTSKCRSRRTSQPDDL